MSSTLGPTPAAIEEPSDVVRFPFPFLCGQNIRTHGYSNQILTRLSSDCRNLFLSCIDYTRGIKYLMVTINFGYLVRPCTYEYESSQPDLPSNIDTRRFTITPYPWRCRRSVRKSQIPIFAADVVVVIVKYCVCCYLWHQLFSSTAGFSAKYDSFPNPSFVL